MSEQPTGQAGTVNVRVPLATHAELGKIQQAIKAKHGWTVSFGDIIAAAVAEMRDES